MRSLFTFTSPPGPCGYLPDRTWRLRYEVVESLTPGEYQKRMLAGWRRFGYSLFRPECPTCTACQSIRIDVPKFSPDKSQKRVRKANDGVVRWSVGPPSVSAEKLALYDKYHAFQAGFKNWPDKSPETAVDYIESYVDNPFVTQEWSYHLGEKLVGVGYVDHLPDGLSAIYFFYDPDERDRSLGTWNVLSVIQSAAEQNLPWVYLGYHVAGCRSLEYKARFRPHQLLGPDGVWRVGE